MALLRAQKTALSDIRRFSQIMSGMDWMKEKQIEQKQQMLVDKSVKIVVNNETIVRATFFKAQHVMLQ